VGGAIANDVHGKNHHRAGTFGSHVRALELLRSDGERLFCSPDDNQDFFHATISGLGLTGLITWAEIQLKPISSSSISGESLRYSSLEEFFEISNASDADWEYTVSWIDCTTRKGRGIFYRGNHSDDGKLSTHSLKKGQMSVPFNIYGRLLNKYSVKLFNNTIYNKHWQKKSAFTKNLIPFFYPLDRIGNWNRLYGANGFLQFQSVVPIRDAHKTTSEMLGKIVDSGMGSFLAVLKVFGDPISPGMMSFPRKGVTLALDFPFRGKVTQRLFNELEAIVADAGGAIYPAKDACMAGENFVQYYPAASEFQNFIDPAFSSNFWRRVNGQ
jgi:FAD/FMN-containing dehydrogenase